MSQTLIRPSTLVSKTSNSLVRGTFFVQTWGCQMNEEDSEQIAHYLNEIGFTPAESLMSAHVILLNTCSVRKKPEDKAFSMLGELLEVKKSRPEVVIGVCGCMAQIRAKEIKVRAPHVDFVVGTGHIASIPGLVEETLQKRKFVTRLDLPERKGAVVTDLPKRSVGRETKVKAFVPIQYGCDKFCTFCIVPTTRGRERSRPTHEILEEVSRLSEAGTREITLLGQTVNSYGKNLEEGKVPFSRLLELVAEVPQLRRIRYTSPYPRDFKEDVIRVICENEKVMEHCHMPLQSGSNDILKAMHRLYSVESFTEIVRALRAAIPQIGLTTDIIVGFPGESEEQFEETKAVMRTIRFDGAYMFAYSSRPGTPAAVEAQVSASDKKRRLNDLIAMQREITREIHESLVGKTFEVLVEGPSAKNPEMLQGYTREFRMMHFAGSPELRAKVVEVTAIQAHLWGMTGKLSG